MKKSSIHFNSFGGFPQNILEKIIQIPSDVEVFSVTNPQNTYKIQGTLGTIEMNLQKIDPKGLCFFELNNKEKICKILVKKTQEGFAMMGTISSLFLNSFEGVSQGFVLYLELVGVGYRANLVENNVEFKLGQSHELIYKIPSGIKAFLVKPTLLGLYGIYKPQLTQVASEIQNLKLPEPYKGKGIRFKNEIVSLKTGKKK